MLRMVGFVQYEAGIVPYEFRVTAGCISALFDRLR